jgi:methyl-accepting chemotaxis protein-1 (serine sensor receptor)
MSWIVNSIRNKVLAVIMLGIATLVASALFGIASAWLPWRTVNDTVIAQAVEAQALESVFKEQVNQWMSVLVRGQEEASLEKSWKQFTFRERQVRRDAEKLRESVQHPEALELLGKFLAAHQVMGERYRRGLEAFKSSNFDARAVDADTKGIDVDAGDYLEDVVKILREEAQQGVAAARADATHRVGVSLIVIAVATLVALVSCGVLIMRTVVRPLTHAVDVVDRVAAGDLTVEVRSTSRDETGRLLDGLRRMRDDMASAVLAIRVAAEGVDQGSRQIASGYVDLSARTEEQAAALEETSASMHQLAVTVRNSSSNAREACEFTAGASRTADQGGKAMADVAATVNEISQASGRVSEIAGLIDSIAFQTNILALNAAIEAARAGEQGRGFAVVAAEVRALSQRSAAAAQDVKSLIRTSVERADEGTRRVEDAGRTIGEIVASVQRVNDMMSEASKAGDEQLAGIEQVSDTVAEMDRVVQQNAALVSESAAAAAQLADHAGQLLQSVARFRLEGDGDATQEAPPAAPPPSGFTRLMHGVRAALPGAVSRERIPA